MKKYLGLYLLLACLTLVAGCDKQQTPNDNIVNQNTQNNQNEQNNNEILDNKTEMVQGELKFENIKIERSGATNIVSGKVTNNSNEVKTFKATLKMYNKSSGRLLGHVSTDTITLQGGSSTEFTVSIMGDYTTVDEFKVEAEYE